MASRHEAKPDKAGPGPGQYNITGLSNKGWFSSICELDKYYVGYHCYQAAKANRQYITKHI